MAVYYDDNYKEETVFDAVEMIKMFGFEKEALAMFKDVDDIDNIYESKDFDSDESTIFKLLDKSDYIYTLHYIDDKFDGYWIIRKLNDKIKYTVKNLKSDVNWLIGHGIDKLEAEKFIKDLMNKVMV